MYLCWRTARAALLVLATGSERVVAVTKDGFAKQVKVVNLASSATGRDGVKVTFPANALVTASGQPVTRTVQMLMAEFGRRWS